MPTRKGGAIQILAIGERSQNPKGLFVSFTEFMPIKPLPYPNQF